jgi:lysophospholipase L1-like esterase
MFRRIRFPLLVLLLAGTIGLGAEERIVLLEQFEFQNQVYLLHAAFAPGQADLHLRGAGDRNLSRGMKGENILLGIRVSSSNFYVFWLNYHAQAIRLAYYDHERGRSRLLPLSGFSHIGPPEIIERDGRLRALLFLADRSHNDDIYYFEPATGRLAQLTDTRCSEKQLTWRETAQGLEVTAQSLGEECTYGFDAQRMQVTTLQRREKIHPRGTAAEEAQGPDYFNTYIGFGDSITWGQIEGVRDLESCYLTQMQTQLAASYGPSSPVNLGAPAQRTYEGALRVNQDLDDHPAFYFLLMLGVNEIWRNTFSLDSSLEDLAFIIDAAQARGMRVIVSTLTPRKDYFSLYQYYWNNLRSLSAGILDLAARKGASSIDTLGAFLNTDPPDGWKALLENIIPGISKGNHPNAKGHELIASLFAGALVRFPPLPPQNVAVLDPASPLQRTASWSVNYESDFSHFHIEFGFHPQALRYSLDTAASYHTFRLFPFLPRLFFRIQAVDRSHNQSAFTFSDKIIISTGAEPGRSHDQRARLDR